jgi:hypothetical protein
MTAERHLANTWNIPGENGLIYFHGRRHVDRVMRLPQKEPLEIAEAKEHLKIVALASGLVSIRAECDVTNPMFSWNTRVSVDPKEYLYAISNARLSQQTLLKQREPVIFDRTVSYMEGKVELFDTQVLFHKCVGNTDADWIPADFKSGLLDGNFDMLLLDSFSVLENSEVRRRESVDVVLGFSEQSVLDVVSKHTDLMTRFSPRAFEVFCGYMLSDLGFHGVKVSRYSQDDGYDIYAVCCDGNEQFTVLVEVKYYSRHSVGLAIIDRLNGVRDRRKVDKGIVITTSSISASARRKYGHGNRKIALVDYDALQNILISRGSQWKVTPSGLWSLPRTE